MTQRWSKLHSLCTCTCPSVALLNCCMMEIVLLLTNQITVSIMRNSNIDKNPLDTKWNIRQIAVELGKPVSTIKAYARHQNQGSQKRNYYLDWYISFEYEWTISMNCTSFSDVLLKPLQFHSFGWNLHQIYSWCQHIHAQNWSVLMTV